MKVLVIDDEPLLRRSLEKVFTTKGHMVLTAENGVEGLKLWTETDPDLIFLDVLMPGMTGWEILAHFNSQPRGKIILMSAFTGQTKTEAVTQAQFDLFLTKPFESIFSVYEQAMGLLNGNQ